MRGFFLWLQPSRAGGIVPALALIVCLFVHAGRLHAADPLTETFQKGLFEEEANRDLAAAVKAYEEVVRQLDGQRKLAATAVFRLGECYRKLGRTNDAVAQFQRVVREYSDDETLAKLSRQNLAGLGVREATVAATDNSERQRLLREAASLSARLQQIRDTPPHELGPVMDTLFNDPTAREHSQATLLRDLSRRAAGFPKELEALRAFSKTNADPRIPQRIEAIHNEAAQIESALQQALVEILEQNEKRVEIMRDLAGRLGREAQETDILATPNREIVLLERQLEELKQIPLERLESVISMIFPDPILDRLNQDYAVQKQALVSLSQNKSSDHPDVRERQAVVDTIRKQIEERIDGTIRAQELKLQALKASQSAGRPTANPPTGDIAAQRATLEREIELAQQQLKIAQTQVSVGRATAEETIKAEREVLRLQRELAALPAGSAEGVRSGTVAIRGESAAEVEAKVVWLRRLSSPDLHLAIHTQMPTERMAELFRQNSAILDRVGKLDRNDDATKVLLENEYRQNQEMMAAEAQAVLRSLELKAEMLRAREKASSTAIHGPLRITLAGASKRPLLLVYPGSFPRDQIPKEQIADPSTVIGTASLAEVLARTTPWAPSGKTNSVVVKRTIDGEAKVWTFRLPSNEATAFSLQDGDVVELPQTIFRF